MAKSIFCLLGFHKWLKPVFTDSFSSNVRDYRQKCANCSKTITWVQPKGIDMRFYPTYLVKRINWLFWIIVLIILIILIILIL